MQKWRGLLVGFLLAVNRMVSTGGLTRRVRETSALVFAPHPDDEILGCGGTILLKVQASTRVKVIVMTDGRASHRGLIAEDELVRMRRAEAQDAARRLGLTDADYVFLGFEDHRLHEYRDAARERIVQIIGQFKPDEIYLPHRNDGLGDHVETNHIVRRAVASVGKPVTLLEYPVWLWNGWPWTPGNARYGTGIVRRLLGNARDIMEIVLTCRARVDISSVLHRKLDVLAAYRSQLQRLNGDSRWPVLSDVADGEFLQRFETDVEMFLLSAYRR
ncbi:MAG: PIG-L family deacetylase [Betaproteobacteria bacterium]|nr:PIG-L family deacetylase [Betaproteobacteria bacterium]